MTYTEGSWYQSRLDSKVEDGRDKQPSKPRFRMSSGEYALVASISSSSDSTIMDGEFLALPSDHYAVDVIDRLSTGLNLKDLPPLPTDIPVGTENFNPIITSSNSSKGLDGASQANNIASKITDTPKPQVKADTNANSDSDVLSSAMNSLSLKTYADATNIAALYPQLAPQVLTMPLTKSPASSFISAARDTSPPIEMTDSKNQNISDMTPSHTDERPNWALAPDPDPVEQFSKPTTKEIPQRRPPRSWKKSSSSQGGRTTRASNASSLSSAFANMNSSSGSGPGLGDPRVPSMISDQVLSQESEYGAKYDYGLHFNYRGEPPIPPYMTPLSSREKPLPPKPIPFPNQQSAKCSDEVFDYISDAASLWLPNTEPPTSTWGVSIEAPVDGWTRSAATKNETHIERYTSSNSTWEYVPPLASTWGVSIETSTEGWKSSALPTPTYHHEQDMESSLGRRRDGYDQEDQTYGSYFPNDDNDGWTGSLPASAYGSNGSKRQRNRRKNLSHMNASFVEDERKRRCLDEREDGEYCGNDEHFDRPQDEWTGSLPASAYGMAPKGSKLLGRNGRGGRGNDSRGPSVDFHRQQDYGREGEDLAGASPAEPNFDSEGGINGNGDDDGARGPRYSNSSHDNNATVSDGDHNASNNAVFISSYDSAGNTAAAEANLIDFSSTPLEPGTEIVHWQNAPTLNAQDQSRTSTPLDFFGSLKSDASDYEQSQSLAQNRLRPQVAGIVVATQKRLSATKHITSRVHSGSKPPAETLFTPSLRAQVSDAVKHSVPTSKLKFALDPFPPRHGRNLIRTPPEQISLERLISHPPVPTPDEPSYDDFDSFELDVPPSASKAPPSTKPSCPPPSFDDSSPPVPSKASPEHFRKRELSVATQACGDYDPTLNL
ncbi:hypothetical protein GYMLUDRAFT_81312 [Collybiopsis luxurians FD-317 M1]|nr:hypothetical protein GYMLUDRAFT_81312 [Collybiopsis luxurians FD-317 M1]